MSEEAEYAPAITMADNAPKPAAPAPRAAFAAGAPQETDPVPANGAARLDPTTQPADRLLGKDGTELQGRGQREVSDSVKAKLKAIAAASAKADTADAGIGGIADDLVPMGTDPAPASPAPATTAAVVPPPATPGPLPAGQLPVLRMPEAATQAASASSAADHERKAALDAREAAIDARHRELEELSKRLPTLDRLAEAPAATVIAWLKDTLGITDPVELKTFASDMMTEVSEQMLDAKLPADLKSQVESRRAVRAVRANRISQDTKEKQLEARRLELEKTAKEAEEKRASEAAERQLTDHIGAQLAPHAGTWKFLHDTTATDGIPAAAIVHGVYKEMERLHKLDPVKHVAPDLATAAKFSDDHYRSRAEAVVKAAAHFQTLLAPVSVPAVEPAKPQASPGGVPGPAPTQQPKPATPPAKEPDPPEYDPMDKSDRQEYRHAQLAARKARYVGGAR
jgi:hypothetical protein